MRRRRGFGYEQDVHLKKMLEDADKLEKHLSHAKYHIEEEQYEFALNELLESSRLIGKAVCNANSAELKSSGLLPLIGRYDHLVAIFRRKWRSKCS